MDWGSAAYRARRHIGACRRAFSERECLALIDFFAARGAATAAEMQQHGSADFVATVLGHVTTAVHGRGRVPRVNGWYRRDEAGTGYVIDPGFAVAWRAARACDGPLPRA